MVCWIISSNVYYREHWDEPMPKQGQPNSGRTPTAHPLYLKCLRGRALVHSATLSLGILILIELYNIAIFASCRFPFLYFFQRFRKSLWWLRAIWYLMIKYIAVWRNARILLQGDILRCFSTPLSGSVFCLPSKLLHLNITIQWWIHDFDICTRSYSFKLILLWT